MVTHVFDNSNLSQEIFAIDTWRAVLCSLEHGRKHMLTILPTRKKECLHPWVRVDQAGRPLPPKTLRILVGT